jgi:hypothetical protein
MKYVIKYEYDNYEEPCECCSYSEQTLTVYDANNAVILENNNVGVWAGNEHELREYVGDKYPEYNNFSVHEDTRWF